ncbi:regulatory protein RecX [Nocardioides baekrokdamisoli]|uniref:Regulatory protein RecX n=1 Tax=Nocardioides baekrokdamisoli TaxID=1804624 RepID=A0A3G9IAQ9_9ACTN|nr:regulatory protein RecX [Nocardioides baekrokdamisoli]BBH15847.1 regulatory protein RecX [Nocardioides baekrokdamisoli]
MADSSAASSGPEWFGDAAAGVDAWLASARNADLTHARPAVIGRSRAAEEKLPEDPARVLPEADAEAVARKILLDQLTGQARSRHELAGKLAKKNVPTEIATALLDRFEEVGLIDDAAFARLWIESRGSQGRGLASRALAQELRRKGIDDEVARHALEEVDRDAERDAANDLVRRKLRSMTALDDQVKTRRLVGMLARKGYSPGLAFAVVREELGAAAVGDLPDSGL